MTALDHAAAGFGGACVGLVVGANWARMTAWLVTRHARTTRAYNATHHGAVTTKRPQEGTWQPLTRPYAPSGHTDPPEPQISQESATERWRNA